ncbi:MAG: DNA repair protein RecO [SAR202 cluster bacterium]|nr:DNA repair protein RecO [SAR202 cluster bacterium]
MNFPATYKTQGVVLKQTPIGEADRVLSIFTRDLGKVRVVARGVRKPRSKLAGHLEPLSHVAISVSRGRSLDPIKEAETVRSFRGVRENLQLVSEAVYLAELVESFSAEDQSSPLVYRLLLGALDWLETNGDSRGLMRYFEVRLLGESGFGPELHSCVECRATLEPGDYLYSSEVGGVLCDDCKVMTGAALMPLSQDANKVLRFYARARLDDAALLNVPPRVAEETDRALRHYVRYLLEREMKSVEFMDLVRREAGT